MLRQMTLLMDFIISPSGVTGEIKSSKTGFLSFVVFMLAIFTGVLANQVLFIRTAKYALPFSLTISLVMAISFFGLATYTLWVHFMLDMFNKLSSTKAILKICCLSLAPLFLCLPVSIILAAWVKNPLPFYSLIALVILLKSLQLMYIGIKESFYLSAEETLVIFFAPVLIIPFIMLILFVSGLAFMYSIIF